jgi:transposase
MKSKVKAKQHENLTETNIRKVMELLGAEKPISKKDACDILNISYNTTRLNKIIEQYKEEQSEQERRRAQNRGKPASEYEIQTVIEGYLDGSSVAEISKRLFRSASFVKDIIDRVGVPQKVVGANWSNPCIIPDQCIRESFEIGQIVWHAKRHNLAIVMEQLHNVKDKDNNYYRVFIIEPMEEAPSYFPSIQVYGGFYDGAFAYDLGSLDHLKQYGVDIYRPYRAHFSKWLNGK